MQKTIASVEAKEIKTFIYLEKIIQYAFKKNNNKVDDNEQYFKLALNHNSFEWEKFSKGIKKDILLYLETNGNTYNLPISIVEEFKKSKCLSQVTKDRLKMKALLSENLRYTFTNSIIDFMEKKNIFIKMKKNHYTVSITGNSFHIKPIHYSFAETEKLIKEMSRSQTSEKILYMINNFLVLHSKPMRHFNAVVKILKEDGNIELFTEASEFQKQELTKAINKTIESFKLYKKEQKESSRNKPVKSKPNPTPIRDTKFSKTKSKIYTTNPASKNIEKVNCSVENETNSSIPNNNY